MSLAPLFAPRSVAVIGASRQPGKLGAAMAASLRGFPGRLALVSPGDPTMHDAVPGPVDLAVLCVPAAACAGALADARARAALVCAGGFAESGPDGADHQRALTEAAARTGTRLLGPNTSGFLAPPLTASFVPGAAEVPAGPVAVVAASGGMNHALAFRLAAAGTGVSLAAGLGAGIDVTAPDVLDHLAADPATRAVALHVEAVGDGRRLVDVVAGLAQRVPVVALVVGRCGSIADFAATHTGALATSWHTTRAALRQAGAVLVDDERDLVDAVTTLSRVRLARHPDPGVGVVTGQAGPALAMLDRLRDVRVPELAGDTRETLGGLLPPLTFQRNPVDTGRPGPGFGDVLATVGADPAVDLLACYALVEPGAVDLPSVAEHTATPTVMALDGPPEATGDALARLGKAGIPAVTGPSAAAAAVRALVDDARGVPRPPVAVQPAATPDGPFDEDGAKALLDTLGITTPARRAATTREEAQHALATLGAPVAVKLLDPTVTHKTEVGGVVLDVRAPAELDAALDTLAAPRVLVERMAPPGVDLVAGAHRDPVFGPVVLLGLGGTVAEALADVAVRLAPLDAVEAAAMTGELAGAAVLDGFRGGPVADRAELGRILAALGTLLAGAPALAGIEINPLRVTADGPVALDAVVTMTDAEDSRAPTDQ